MSRVHDAMRNLEQKNLPEKTASANMTNLVGALLQELADELPDDPKLESVRADFLTLSRTYESSKRKDLVLRFYLATRGLIREYEALQERVKRAEKRHLEPPNFETPAMAEAANVIPAEPTAIAKAAGA